MRWHQNAASHFRRRRRRPLYFVACFSFFVNLLLAPALFMLQIFDRVLTSQSKETTLLELTPTNGIVLKNVAIEQLHADDFIFG